jgi:hypothetical protein
MIKQKATIIAVNSAKKKPSSHKNGDTGLFTTSLPKLEEKIGVRAGWIRDSTMAIVRFTLPGRRCWSVPLRLRLSSCENSLL